MDIASTRAWRERERERESEREREREREGTSKWASGEWVMVSVMRLCHPTSRTDHGREEERLPAAQGGWRGGGGGVGGKGPRVGSEAGSQVRVGSGSSRADGQVSRAWPSFTQTRRRRRQRHASLTQVCTYLRLRAFISAPPAWRAASAAVLTCRAEMWMGRARVVRPDSLSPTCGEGSFMIVTS